MTVNEYACKLQRENVTYNILKIIINKMLINFLKPTLKENIKSKTVKHIK